MTGRGIDQILPHPGDPRLHESHVHSALGYVQLAEAVAGPIDRPVDFAYVWGDALAELERRAPHARIVNLETAVTRSARPWPGKGIHYRMHPDNAGALQAAGLDCCVLANNHVMDWGVEGLLETLTTLAGSGIRTAGAGSDALRAAAPAQIPLAGGGRVLVYAWALPSSGVPGAWRAGRHAAGVNLLQDLSTDSLDVVARGVAAERRSGDVVVVSLHWGGNWGYAVSAAERAFARGLIESAGVDIVHGHSSHHVRGIELHRERLILYGCGDLLNDYEGIGGREAFRGELALLYFPTLAPDGSLRELVVVPTRTRRLRIERASAEETAWLQATLDREGQALGTRVEPQADGALLLRRG